MVFAMQEITNRIVLVANHFNLTTNAFAHKIGVDPSNMAKMMKGNLIVSKRTINKILSSLPISEEWLLSGKGDMLLPGSDFKPHQQTTKQDPQSKIVPLIPISAQGGSLNDFSISVMNYECEKVVSPIIDVDFAISISGDSMAPEYPSGCQVLIKKINESAFIEWGKVYVLDTCNGTIIKKLMPSKSPDKVLCVSINPAYPQFEVAFKYIQGIYRVMMVMAVK